MLDLALSVKIAEWRAGDDTAAEADRAFRAARAVVLARDHTTCQGCGLPSQGAEGKSGYLEVHHRDDDHHHNDPDNLLTVCPFCHAVKHFALAHVQDRGFFVPARGVGQRALHRLLSVLWFEPLARAPDLAPCRQDLTDWIARGQALMTAPPYRDLADGAALGNRLRDLTQSGNREALTRLQERLKTVLLVPNLAHPAYQKAARYWSDVLSPAWTDQRVARYIAGQGDRP